jgi:glutamine amidotransferase
MIVILDYGMGNVGSVLNMIKYLGAKAKVTNQIKEIEFAKKIIIPGVGAFDKGIQNIRNLNLTEVLNFKVIESRTPILGICLGMQLLTNYSEEGGEKGLAWVDADTLKFPKELRVPYMGWNYVNEQKNSLMCEGLEYDSRFYFVHSYYVNCKNPNDILLTTEYEDFTYTSAFEKNNIFGVQFHPEKSHKFGKVLMKNFIKI